VSRETTGVIIDSRHVLTAAHCDPKAFHTQVFVYAGSAILPAPYTVERVNMRLGVNPAANDFWDDTNLFADVAVLRIQGFFPPPYRAAELAPTYPGSFVSGWAVGKGSHDGNSNPVQEMRWVNATTASFSDVGGFFLMAGQKTNPGDSGGPFYVSSDTQAGLRVVGVLSGGAGIDTFGVDAYASVGHFNAWIRAQIVSP
jgi:secreted trypsin-like serine protease